jgi:hypothetical protein
MFSKRHEQDLADIKNATKELGERLQTVVERLDKLAEAQAAPSASGAEAAADATAEPASKRQRKRGARAAGGAEGSAPGGMGTKAERRARAAQQQPATVADGATDEEAPPEGRRKRQEGRTKREVRAGSQEPVAVGAEAAANGSAGDADQEQAGDDASSSAPTGE